MRPRLLVCLIFAAVVAIGACRSFSTAEGSTPAEKIYNGRCITCHGKNGAGADGPSLIDRDVTRAQILEQITNGNVAKGMPAYKDRLSAADIQLAADWVVELRTKAGRSTPP